MLTCSSHTACDVGCSACTIAMVSQCTTCEDGYYYTQDGGNAYGICTGTPTNDTYKIHRKDREKISYLKNTLYYHRVSSWMRDLYRSIGVSNMREWLHSGYRRSLSS